MDFENGENIVKMRVIYYAEPKDPNCKPKSVADSESLEARWVSLDEFKAFKNIRGYELVEFVKMMEGGQLAPLSILKED